MLDDLFSDVYSDDSVPVGNDTVNSDSSSSWLTGLTSFIGAAAPAVGNVIAAVQKPKNGKIAATAQVATAKSNTVFYIIGGIVALGLVIGAVIFFRGKKSA